MATNPSTPPWAAPTNSTSPESSDPHSWLQDFAIAIEVVMPVLALFVASLRYYIRASTKNLGWDDYWIFLAMLFCIGQLVISIMFIKVEYVGIHNADVPAHDENRAVLLNYIAGLIYNPILSMVKISVLLFLLRLADTRRAVKVYIWALMTFTACMMIAIFCSVMFVCDPVQYTWDPSIPGGKCFDKRPFAVWTAAVTIFTDLLVLILPFWIFLGLRMARKAKIALLCVFALGFIVTIVGCVRLYFIYRANYVLAKLPDGNFNIGYVTTCLETNLAIMAASGPALWPLARRWFPRFFSNLGLEQGYQGDIPDIVTVMPHELALAKRDSGRSSRSGRLKLLRVFSAGSRERRRDSVPVVVLDAGIERTSNRAGQQDGVYANRTIGGTAFALKDMRGDRARGTTEIRSSPTPFESEEEIGGIMRRTDYTVTRDDRSSGATEGSWVDRGDKRRDGGTERRTEMGGRSSMGSI